MVKVEFHFDFGSPNAYLSHLVIPEIEKRTGVKFEYVPVLLGGVFKLTNNRSPAESLRGIKNKPEYERLEMTPLHQAPRDYPLSEQSLFSGEHPDDDARSDRRAVARRVRALRRRDVPAHVGRAKKDGRPQHVSRARSTRRGCQPSESSS